MINNFANLQFVSLFLSWDVYACLFICMWKSLLTLEEEENLYAFWQTFMFFSSFAKKLTWLKSFSCCFATYKKIILIWAQACAQLKYVIIYKSSLQSSRKNLKLLYDSSFNVYLRNWMMLVIIDYTEIIQKFKVWIFKSFS